MRNSFRFVLLWIVIVGLFTMCSGSNGKIQAHGDDENVVHDKWIKEHNTYVNYDYGFMWHLNDNLQWEKRDDLFQKEAVFAALNPERNIVCYITVAKSNEKDNDIWRMKDDMFRAAKMTDETMWDRELLETECVKLSGSHALKEHWRYLSSEDDRFADNPVNMIAVQYFVLHNGAQVTFHIMAIEQIENDLENSYSSIESALFAGVLLTKPEALKR